MSPETRREPGVGSPAPDNDHLIGAAPRSYTRPETAEDVTGDTWSASVLRGEWHQLGLMPTDRGASDVD